MKCLLLMKCDCGEGNSPKESAAAPFACSRESLPKAMLAAGATLMKLGGGIYKAVDPVGDAFDEETVLTVDVRRHSFAIEDK
jgi:hypothetical protein